VNHKGLDIAALEHSHNPMTDWMRVTQIDQRIMPVRLAIIPPNPDTVGAFQLRHLLECEDP
jgi:hypothetical protein